MNSVDLIPHLDDRGGEEGGGGEVGEGDVTALLAHIDNVVFLFTPD